MNYSLVSAKSIFSLFELKTPSQTPIMNDLKQRITNITKHSLKELMSLSSLAQECIQPLTLPNTQPLTLKFAELKMRAFQEAFKDGILTRSTAKELLYFNLISPEGSLYPPSTSQEKGLRQFLIELNKSGETACPHELAFKISLSDITSETLPARASCYTTHLEDLQILNTHIEELEQAITSCEEADISQGQYVLFEKISCTIDPEKEWSLIKDDFDSALKKIKEIKTHILPHYKSLQFHLKKHLRHLYSPVLENATIYTTCYHHLAKNPSDIASITRLKSPLKPLKDYDIVDLPALTLSAPHVAYLQESQAIHPTIVKTSRNPSICVIFDLFNLQQQATTLSMQEIKSRITKIQESSLPSLISLHQLADRCIQDFSTSTYMQADYRKAQFTMDAYEQVFTQGFIAPDLLRELTTLNLIQDGCLSSSDPHLSLQNGLSYTSFVQDMHYLNTHINEIENHILFCENAGLTPTNCRKLEPTIKKITDPETFLIYKNKVDHYFINIDILKQNTLRPLKKLQSEMSSILTTFKAHTLMRANSLKTHYKTLSEDTSGLASWLNPLSLNLARASRYIWHPRLDELKATLTHMPYKEELTELLKSLKDG
jgi:hypothetical protein